MENNDSPQPQQTGGLKLMTVFIGVLALHVVVIGGFTVYHLMSGGSSDSDLVVDKNHKDVKVTPDSATLSEGQLTDATAPDKSATAPASSTDTTGNPTIPASPTDASVAAATPAAQAAPVPPPQAAPAPAIAAAPAPTSGVPSGPMQSGPVITPPPSPPATAPAVASEPAASPSVNTEAKAAGTATYTVKAHETLARIAHRNHLKLAALRAANGLTSDKLTKGQKLVIPARTEVASTRDESEQLSQPAPASSGPDRTLLGDSPTFSKSVARSAHDKATVASGGSSRHSYTVSKGDTLNRIAHKFHTSTNAIMALNNISDARKLHPGQKLRIPSQESRSARSAPAASTPDRIEPRATPSAQLANFIN